MLQTPFYDPTKTFEDNFDNGPFGAFVNTKPQTVTEKPKYSFLGFPINSPFGIPAGPLPNSTFIKAAFDMGFDVLCYKTQRSVTFPSNQFPNVLFVETNGDLTIEKSKNPLLGKRVLEKNQERFSITNSFGNPSKGIGFWKDDLQKALSYQGEGQLLIMSVVGTIQEGFTQENYYDDFALAAEEANKTGVKAIEVNLSCPNVASEGVLCYTPSADEAICRKTREKIGKTKLIAKLGYFSHDQQELLESVVEAMVPYVDAISVINTIPAPIVDENGNQALPGKGRLVGGVCGAGIKWAGIDSVQRLQELKTRKGYNFEIIGVGGVMNTQDFKEYRDAGADVVQSATGAMWNPFLAQEIKASLNSKK